MTDEEIVSDDSDTVSLLEACRRLGIGKTMGYRIASSDNPVLGESIRVLRFGTVTRPVYRVSKAQLDAALQAGGSR